MYWMFGDSGGIVWSGKEHRRHARRLVRNPGLDTFADGVVWGAFPKQILRGEGGNACDVGTLEHVGHGMGDSR